jgi:hypothetical protein
VSFACSSIRRMDNVSNEAQSQHGLARLHRNERNMEQVCRNFYEDKVE